MKIEELVFPAINSNKDSIRLYIKWDVVETIDAFNKLKETNQSDRWHGEGNAWNHTINVCKRMESEINESLINRYSVQERKILLISALFHDIGKITTTTQDSRGVYHSYGHEFESERMTREILWDEKLEAREAICALIRYHMVPLNIFREKNYLDKIVFLGKNTISLYFLYLLKKCDHYGSIVPDKNDFEDSENRLNAFQNIIHGFAGCNFNEIPDKKDVELLLSKKGQIIVTVMIGISGSGKDTYISKKINDDNTEIVSRDKARIELGLCKEGEKYLGTSAEEDSVTQMVRKNIVDAAKAGKNIVINDMNLKRKYRDNIKDLLKGFNVMYEYIYIQPETIEENIERRNGTIPENIIRSMIAKIDWPTTDEFSNLKCFISKNGEFFQQKIN